MSDSSENLINFETKANVDDIITKDDESLNLIEQEIEPEVAEIEETKKEEWEDVLGSGGLMKKIIREGKSDTRPQRLERCIINYECTLEDGKLVERQDHFELLLGDCEVKLSSLRA